MKNFWARLFVLLPVAALAACGFHPLYASGGLSGDTSGKFANIYVEPMPERVGYELRNDLLDLFNAPTEMDHAGYRLQLILKEVREPLAFKGDASITRYNYRLSAHYELFALPKEESVKVGDVRSIAAYNVAQSPYATVAGQKDAESRAALSVAERVRTELAVFFQNKPAGSQVSANVASGQPLLP